MNNKFKLILIIIIIGLAALGYPGPLMMAVFAGIYYIAMRLVVK